MRFDDEPAKTGKTGDGRYYRRKLAGGGTLELTTWHDVPDHSGSGVVNITLDAELTKDAINKVFAQAESKLNWEDRIMWEFTF